MRTKDDFFGKFRDKFGKKISAKTTFLVKIEETKTTFLVNKMTLIIVLSYFSCYCGKPVDNYVDNFIQISLYENFYII